MEASATLSNTSDPLMAEVSALCADEDKGKLTERWNSEELLSSCHLLINTAIPSSSLFSIDNPPSGTPQGRSITELCNAKTESEKYHASANNFELSISSSSSSFNSCESALEEIWKKDGETSPPQMFHSCCSLVSLHSDESPTQEDGNVGVNTPTGTCSDHCQHELTIDSSPSHFDFGRELPTGASDKRDSKPFSFSHATLIEKPVQPYDSSANGAQDGPNTKEQKRTDDVLKVYNSRHFHDPGDKDNEKERFVSENTEENEIFPFSPDNCYVVDTSFVPSSVASDAVVDAKLLGETRLPLRGAQYNDAYRTSVSRARDFVYVAHKEGQVVTDDVCNVSCKSTLPQECQPTCDEKVGSTPFDVYYNTSNFRKDVPGNVLKETQLQNGARYSTTKKLDWQNSTEKGGQLYIPPYPSSFEILLHDVIMENNWKYFPFSSINLYSQESLRSNQSKSLKDTELQDTSHIESSTRLKRLSNLYYASPALVTEECSEDEKGPSICMSDCKEKEGQARDLNDFIPNLNNVSILTNNTHVCNSTATCNTTETTIFHPNARANNKIYNDIAFDIEVKECQKSQSFGTESDLVASDSFGLVEKTYPSECRLEELVGQVQFSVGPELFSFPLLAPIAERASLERENSAQLILCLATCGENWNLSVNSDGYPVVSISDTMTSFSEWQKDENVHTKTPNYAGKLYGFTVIPTANSKIKSLVPLFASPNHSESTKDLSGAKEPEVFFYGDHRYSAACDVQMYRGVDVFVPENKKESVIRDNTHADGPPLKLREVSFKFDDGIEAQGSSDKSASPQTLKPPPVVLRSKSETKIKPFRREQLEGIVTPERSNSLNGSAKASTTNLSSFKGMTSPLEEDSSDISKAAAFISSIVQQSLCPEKLSARISALKKERNKASTCQESESNSCPPTAPISAAPSAFSSSIDANIYPKYKTESNNLPSFSNTTEIPSVPNLKNAIAVNTIVSHLNSSKKNFSARPKIALTCAPVSTTTSSPQIGLITSTSVNTTETPIDVSSSPPSFCPPTTSATPVISSSELFPSSHNTYIPPQSHKEAVSILSSHITPRIKPDFNTALPPSSASSFTCVPAQSFVTTPSHTSIASHYPSLTPSSTTAESSFFQDPSRITSKFSSPIVAKAQNFVSSIPSTPHPNETHFVLPSYSTPSSSREESVPLSGVSSLSSSGQTANISSASNSEHDPAAFSEIKKLNTSDSYFNQSISKTQDYLPSDTIYMDMDPSLDAENSQREGGSFYRGMAVKNKAMDITKQLETRPSRHAYSTKFPMDVICQGKLLETRRRTAPNLDLDNEPTDPRQRKSSVGQVQPFFSYQRTAYPTSRSMSTGRMELGRRRVPLASLLSSEGNEGGSENEVEEKKESCENEPFSSITDSDSVKHSSKPESPPSSTATELINDTFETCLRKDPPEASEARSRLPKLRSSHSFNVKLVEGEDVRKVIKGAVYQGRKKSHSQKREEMAGGVTTVEESAAEAGNESRMSDMTENKELSSTLTDGGQENFSCRDNVGDFANVLLEPILQINTLFPLVKKKKDEEETTALYRVAEEEEKPRLRGNRERSTSPTDKFSNKISVKQVEPIENQEKRLKSICIPVASLDQVKSRESPKEELKSNRIQVNSLEQVQSRETPKEEFKSNDIQAAQPHTFYSPSDFSEVIGRSFEVSGAREEGKVSKGDNSEEISKINRVNPERLIETLPIITDKNLIVVEEPPLTSTRQKESAFTVPHSVSTTESTKEDSKLILDSCREDNVSKDARTQVIRINKEDPPVHHDGTEVDDVKKFPHHVCKPLFKDLAEDVTDDPSSVGETKRKGICPPEHLTDLIQESLPEPVMPLTLVVEEALEYIDDEDASLGVEGPPQDQTIGHQSSVANDGTVVVTAFENIPTSTPSLAASLSFSLSPKITSSDQSPSKTATATVTTTTTTTTTTTSSIATTSVKITSDGGLLHQPPVAKQQKTELVLAKEDDFSSPPSVTVKGLQCAAVLSASSKSEDESQSSVERPPTDGDLLLASASASSTGSALSWGSTHGPVARRDLLPLEDEEVQPRWEALLAVNSPESDEEGRTGYESDDDFESMDAEMRRLEEKLRKFERELGISSGEDLSPENVTTGNATQRGYDDPAAKPRLRQEDIDVLKSFSLPDVYPPVNVLKTKHLSLMKETSSLFTEDSENDSNHSVESSTMVVQKLVKKLRPGERRWRSLDLQKLTRNKKGSKISAADFMVTDLNQTVDINDVLDKAGEAADGHEFEPSFDEWTDSPLHCVSKAEQVTRYDEDIFTMKESHYGYLWREKESDMTALDFEALESFNDPSRHRQSLFFIFEDDDDDDPEEQDSCLKEFVSLDCPEDNSVMLQDEFNDIYSGEDLVAQEGKKRDLSLVTAFKNSFRKAAKYLGPNPFGRPKDEDPEDFYFPPSHQPLNNNLLHIGSPQNTPSECKKVTPEPQVSGRYNVRTAQVQSHPLFESDSGEVSLGSGEYHASPAVCVLSSDENMSRASQRITETTHPCVPISDMLYQNVTLKTDHAQIGCSYDMPQNVSHTKQKEDFTDPSLRTKDHLPPEKPPPVPPRRSLLIYNMVESESDNQCQRVPKTNISHDDTNTKVTPKNAPDVPPRSHSSHKPTSVKQLKRKKQERIESQKAEDALEAAGCTFCVGVPIPRGRPDQPGNHNRHPSPHPRALPERRTWPPRARSEEQVAKSRAWLDAERVWLVHRGGFCAGRKLPEAEEGANSPLQEGRIKLQLEHTDDVIEVDEDDIEKANPPTFDRCEDLSHLRYLNESSILHTLRQRYGSNLIHTYAGSAMVVINPTTPLAIYSEKVIQMFKGCKLEDMPPHIYAVGQATYRDLINTRRDQSIVFLGRSGAGKTTNFRHVLHYLALAAGVCNKILTVEKLNAISTLLEAFGNSRTVLNTNATRFTQMFSLDFDHSGQIASASVQVYMPEKMRVVRRPQGEPNYHIFYQLLSGADEDLKSFLGLDNLTADTNLFMTPLQRNEDKQRAGIAWARIRAALDVLKVSEDEQKAIWSVLSSIYHIGTASAIRVGNSNKFQFAKPVHAQKAAGLLGTSVEELARTIFTSAPSSAASRNSYRTGPSSPTDKVHERPDGLEAIEGIAAGLYAETFNAIVALINRCISTSAHTANSILVVDSPGFQNPASMGRNSGASFSDLCHNYAQERLQMLFHDVTFTAQTDRYAQEHIECGDVTDELGTPAPLISLLDKTSSNSVVRTSQVDLREADRRGLLWLLDEEAIFPGASDQSFLQRLFTHYGDREFSNLINKGVKPDQFVLHHFQGTNPVSYGTQGWLKASRENPVARQAAALLQESNREILSRLFVFSRGPVSNTISGSVVGIEGSQSLRRASSIRRAFTTGTASFKRKSVCLQVKFTVDGIIETLRRTKLKFVHCLLPQHNAGLCDLKGSPQTPSKTSFEDVLLNVPLVRSQIRGCQILDALRLHKQGFPEHLQYPEFRRRFSVLAPSEARMPLPIKDEKVAAEAILPHLDLDSSSYRLGLSQIFFRTGTISRLEEQRDLVLTDTIVRLQAVCRGVLARRAMQKRKVQETAIRCIQKNVRKFLAVRDWPWWRLLVRVTPLLNVHRTEEELRSTKDELENLRARLERAEKERQDLKHENEKLEARLEDLSSGSDDDDEFYDVQVLPGFCIPGRPQINPPGIQGPIVSGTFVGSTRGGRTPAHSHSLPAVNKINPSTKMGNTQPGNPDAQQVGREVPSSPSQQAAKSSPPPASLVSPAGIKTSSSKTSLDANMMKSYYKKYQAPQPPVSREPSFKSTDSRTPRSSLDDSLLNVSLDSVALAGESPGCKKPHRNPSFKKYRAPPPPSATKTENLDVIVNGTEEESHNTNAKLLGSPALTKKMKPDQTADSQINKNISTEGLDNKERSKKIKENGSSVEPNLEAKTSSKTDQHPLGEETTKETQMNGYLEQINRDETVNGVGNDLNMDSKNKATSEKVAIEQNKDETLDKKEISTKCKETVMKDEKKICKPEEENCNEDKSSSRKAPNPQNMTVSNSSDKGRGTEGDLKLTVGGDPSEPDKKRKKGSGLKLGSASKDSESDRGSKESINSSSRVVTPEPGQKIVFKRTVSGKLASLTNKFEAEDKISQNDSGKPNSKSGSTSKVGKLGGLATKFELEKNSSSTKASTDRKSSLGEKSEKTIMNQYSKTFLPDAGVMEKNSRKRSIGGIDLSKFGGFVKPVDYLHAQKTKKENDNLPAEKKVTDNQVDKQNEDIKKTPDLNLVIEPIKEESSTTEPKISSENSALQETKVPEVSSTESPTSTLPQDPVAPSVSAEKAPTEVTSSEVNGNLDAKQKLQLKNVPQTSLSVENKVTEVAPDATKTIKPVETEALKNSETLPLTQVSPEDKAPDASHSEIPSQAPSSSIENEVTNTSTGNETDVKTVAVTEPKDSINLPEVLSENKATDSINETPIIHENKLEDVITKTNESSIEANQVVDCKEANDALVSPPVTTAGQTVDATPSEASKEENKIADTVLTSNNIAESSIEANQVVDRKDANDALVFPPVTTAGQTVDATPSEASKEENKITDTVLTSNNMAESSIEANQVVDRKDANDALVSPPVTTASQTVDATPLEASKEENKITDTVLTSNNMAEASPEVHVLKDDCDTPLASRPKSPESAEKITDVTSEKSILTPDKEVFEDALEALTPSGSPPSVATNQINSMTPECLLSKDKPNSTSVSILGEAPKPLEITPVGEKDPCATKIDPSETVKISTTDTVASSIITENVEEISAAKQEVSDKSAEIGHTGVENKSSEMLSVDSAVINTENALPLVSNVTSTSSDVIPTVNKESLSNDLSIPLKLPPDLPQEKLSLENNTSIPHTVSSSESLLQKDSNNEVTRVTPSTSSADLGSSSNNSPLALRHNIPFITPETTPTTSSQTPDNQSETMLQKMFGFLRTSSPKDTGNASSFESVLSKPLPGATSELSNEAKALETLELRTGSTQAECKKAVDPSYNLPLLRPSSLVVASFPQTRSLSDLGCAQKTTKIVTPAPESKVQLSVRPKVRRRSYERPISKEVLNISEILRDAEDRLSKALTKNLPKKSDSGTQAGAYDPSKFDTLMPLPDADDMNLGERHSRSSTPFMDRSERSPTPKRVFEQTEAVLIETDRILRKTRSQNSLRRSYTRSLSGVNINRLTEVTADLNEEHTTAQLASERIEAEQSERMRLEKDVAQLQMDIKRMTTSNDKLEMEKLRLKNEVLQHAELNGDIDDETADASLYKRKYEWCLREIDVLKKQLKQQQEDDLDQLLTLKKQLEKKVADAYEETDEQRQVVGQMKKKSQRLQAEMNDMKILLEEQTSRNNLLEKKQRKFDQDMQSVVEEQRNERLAKEKIQREKDQILAEKYSFEQEVSTLKLELELKDEKLSTLTRELDDLSFTGKAEEEVAILKKAKHDLELRVKDQEEELDDLAGQVQMLESAKIRLEMSIEQIRKENRKELSQRDEEVEEIRMSAQKKIKGLEAQLELEHEERTQLVREKHDLERRLVEAHNRNFATVDEDAFHRVKKELKKTKALLKDTQTMLEKTQSEGSNKLLLRQLKTQLEDAEFAKMAAIKAKQCTESDFSEVQTQLEEAQRARKDIEEKLIRVTKEKTEVQTQLEESEEEVAEVMKKYKATVSQLSVDQINISEQAQLIADLEHDKQVLQDKLSELSSKVEVLEGETANIHTQRRLQMKIKELESKLDLESTTRQRLESQITRLKDQVERISAECDSIRLKESQAVEHSKKLTRQLREAKEDVTNLQAKLTESVSKKQEADKQLELSESEILTLKSDLKLAFKRIEDLQQALQGDISDSDTEISDSSESETSLTSFLTGTRPDFSSSNLPYRTSSPDSKGDLMGTSSVNDLMAVIKEDTEDDYKESFA